MKKRIQISITDFALPSPRRGSIDIHSGYGRGALIGVELHQRVQAARSKMHNHYKAEVPIRAEFEIEKYIFEVSGRIDGFFDGDHPRIEEIKSSFNIYDLARTLREVDIEHPYVLQLLSYGYFYWLQHQIKPDLNLHLISSRIDESSDPEFLDLDLKFDLSQYKSWLDRRLNELTVEAHLSEKRINRRKKVAKNFQFPFSQPRSGQIELIQTIEEGLVENRPMLLQAPTGLGKTVGVMFPTLREALSRGQKLIYLTPKNSQHAVAEEAIDRLQEKGAAVKAMTLTAKSKMCFKNEPLCNPEYCEFAKDHYTKIDENQLLQKLSKKRRLSARIFKNIAQEYQVCPFELQLDAATDVDAVICDYNYVFAPRSAFGRLTYSGLLSQGKPNLVIDEAHNLPSRAMDYYSPSLSVVELERMREDILEIPKKFHLEAKSLLDECVRIVESCGDLNQIQTLSKAHNKIHKKNQNIAHKISPPVSRFLSQDAELRAFLSVYLRDHKSIESGDPILRLCFYWSEFTASLDYAAKDRKEFFTTFHSQPASIKITCCDASDMLKSCYKEYANVIGFSATLKPFDFYSQLSGLKSSTLKTAEFISPFPKEHRKLLIIPQISSKYSERARNYPRIASAIEKIAELKKGNYIAFFPSFDFMYQVLEAMNAPQGFRILRQERKMRREQIDEVLDILKTPGQAHVLFAVQGGVFSEGVDYPGEMVVGAFVVGPALPHFDLEREGMREYYEKNYESGFDYAYTFPAMAKVIQSAGRVIRSESDRGLIVLMDNRFIQSSFAKSMPQDWFDSDPRELVSERILHEISSFWSKK